MPMTSACFVGVGWDLMVGLDGIFFLKLFKNDVESCRDLFGHVGYFWRFFPNFKSIVRDCRVELKR